MEEAQPWYDSQIFPNPNARLQAWHEVARRQNGRTTLGVLAADELKTFYYEAKGVQPGRRSPMDVLRWFWLETAAGEAIVAMRDHAAQSADPAMKGLATLSLVPRAVLPLLAERGAG